MSAFPGPGRESSTVVRSLDQCTRVIEGVGLSVDVARARAHRATVAGIQVVPGVSLVQPTGLRVSVRSDEIILAADVRPLIAREALPTNAVLPPADRIAQPVSVQEVAVTGIAAVARVTPG